jgi:type II secretory pathway pseudopilin PulG
LELLLTVALLLALLAAVVYNFESAKRGTDLEEGARQVEALIRFAGAQAANSGKAVQLRFGDGVDVSSSTNSISETSTSAVNDIPAIEDLEDWGAKLRVVYEVDPVLQPGVFADLPEARAFLDAIGERVRIEKVRTPERPLNQSTNELAIVEGSARAAEASAVTFYPDGSSDTVDIFLVSKEREDFREMIVRLDGVTGSVRTELRGLDDLVPIEWMEDENSPQKQTSTETGSAKEPAAIETASSTTPPPMPEDPAFSEPAKNDTTTTNLFEDFPE